MRRLFGGLVGSVRPASFPSLPFLATPALLATLAVFATLSTSCAFCRRDSTEDKTLDDVLSTNRGKVLLLLLGRDGCPGTAKATAVLEEYVPTMPEGVSVLRIDVPLPGERMRVSPGWNHLFPRMVDTDRAVAGRLEFFYYPTFYVFDREGEMRFSGGCDKDGVATMTREILSDKPGATKRTYTLPMPAVGSQAPDFLGATLDGASATLESLRGKRGTVLFFARTSCPFSLKELPNMERLAGSWREAGVSAFIVNQGETPDAIRPVYEEKCAGARAICDETGDISLAYGVDAVPYFFLLDSQGKVLKHRSFTDAAASDAVNSMLGLEAAKPRYEPAKGG